MAAASRRPPAAAATLWRSRELLLVIALAVAAVAALLLLLDLLGSRTDLLMVDLGRWRLVEPRGGDAAQAFAAAQTAAAEQRPFRVVLQLPPGEDDLVIDRRFSGLGGSCYALRFLSWSPPDERAARLAVLVNGRPVWSRAVAGDAGQAVEIAGLRPEGRSLDIRFAMLRAAADPARPASARVEFATLRRCASR